VKRIPDLTEAFLGPVLERHPDAFLLLVGGPDPYHPISEELVARLESHPRVRITGHLDDPSPYYRVMDVLAFPSSREGFPGVCLEASSSGVPVVGYRVTGVVDAIVDGVTGSLAQRHDIANLADGISLYLTNPALGESHGASGRERIVALFQRERVWQHLDRALADALADFGPGEPNRLTPRTGTGIQSSFGKCP
jgi:glycosyltransferase involved in cell wall biosynthesis